MNPRKDLASLHSANARRLQRFQSEVGLLDKLDDQQRDQAVARVCIESLNQWSNFSRAFYLSCVGGARTKKGTIARTALFSFVNAQAALDYATVSAKPHIRHFPVKRREEPPWFDPALLLKLTYDLSLTNQASIIAGLSGKTYAFQHMPVFRNFFAHRNEDTHRKTTRIEADLGGPIFKFPSRYLLHIPTGKTTSVIEEWLIDLSIISDIITD